MNLKRQLLSAVLFAALVVPADAAVCRGESGIASWYSYTGHRTASGGPYSGQEMTAAHKTLPFGSRVRVTNLATGRSIVVTVDDRGPWVRGRIIDLSPRAKRALGMGGLAHVCVTVVG